MLIRNIRILDEITDIENVKVIQVFSSVNIAKTFWIKDFFCVPTTPSNFGDKQQIIFF